ncbi:SDR family oxidoreductase [Shimia sp. CNT1-13L.2]|uniref:SDR family NAD(P)-dependent oxidoreductase n=1 Tax=Shimia sp. CNT1-13L.2 TaxID=2959663 RepID=UPI0020CDFCCD|nr:SDR family oxidoreductase [Shimia sp. CNT1-13L.2]MCP9483285.1 SDR family oxidoreductase [Shimia sp. CNT1-13L.2]
MPASNLFNIDGRVAVVTGASSGLGQRAATILARSGAKVVGVARRGDALEDWANGIGDNAAVVAGDVANLDMVDDLARQLAAPFGAPDIIVHAAGLNPRLPAEDLTPDVWSATLAVNLSAPFFLSQAFVPAMKKSGWGRIVNFASLQSFRAFPNGLPYGASKGGVAQMTRAMAEAWSSSGIMVNAIAPGFFETELTASVFADPERAARNAAQTCIGRNGEAEDLDGPLLFLCSDASRYVTGQILMLDGGFTAK